MALQQPILALVLAIAATLFLARTSTGFRILVQQSDEDLEFVKEACNSTLYQSLCISSLSPYTRYVHKNQRKLSICAITVSLAAANNATGVLYELREATGKKSSERAALNDCLSMVSDSSSQMRDSIKELKRLNRRKRKSQVANVQTWLSAALTNEDSCTDGFSDLPGKDQKIVNGTVGCVMELNSNALALVNRFADTMRH